MEPQVRMIEVCLGIIAEDIAREKPPPAVAMVYAKGGIEATIQGPAAIMLRFAFQYRVAQASVAFKATDVATIWPLIQPPGTPPQAPGLDWFGPVSYQHRGQQMMLNSVFSGGQPKTIGWSEQRWVSHVRWREKAKKTTRYYDLFDHINLLSNAPSDGATDTALADLEGNLNTPFQLKGPWPAK